MECGPENCPLTAWATLSQTERKLQRKPLVVKLHKQGFPPEDISDQFGISLATVYRDLDISHDEKCQGKDTLGRKKSTGRPKNMPKQDKVRDAVEHLVSQGKPVNRKKIAAEFGVGQKAVQLAAARAEGRREAQQAEPVITPDMLSMSAQVKLDMAIRQRMRKIDAELKQGIQDGVRKYYDEVILPDWREKVDQAQELYKHRRGAMDKATFNKIRRALHPDSRLSISDKMLAEAFDAFMNLEKYLLDEKDSPTDLGGLPSNFAEWDAARAAVRARNSERAKRTTATKTTNEIQRR